jgi:hypothetical protein
LNGQQNITIRIRLRIRHGNAALRQMLHQIQIKRQLLMCEALKQREHIAARFCINKIVGVFNAALAALEIGHSAQAKLGKHGLRLFE